MELPLCIYPLSAGDYDAQLLYGSQFARPPQRPLTNFKLHIVNDDQARADWLKRRIEDLRKRDSFAAYVGIRYDIPEVLDELASELDSDVPLQTQFAGGVFSFYRHPPYPPKALEAIDHTLQKHIAEDPVSKEWGLAVAAMLDLTQSHPDDHFLPTVVHYSENQNFYVRDSAIMALQAFHQDAASDQLAKLVDQKDLVGRSIIAQALASRGDERGLPALAEIVSEDNQSRSGGRTEFDLLVVYPDV